MVEPINKLVHQDFPRALKAGDMERLRGLHAQAAWPSARERAAALVGGFSQIEASSCVIDAVTPAGRDRLEVDALLRLDGRLDGGARRSVWQRLRVRCARLDGVWLIEGSETVDGDEVIGDVPSYRDRAAELGVAFVQESCGVVDECGVTREFLAGSGVGVGDLDGDGEDDVVLVGGRDVQLYVNRGGQLVDESSQRGFVPIPLGEGRFPVIADLDGDGARDVLVTVLGSQNLVYKNRGDGTFAQIASDDLGITSNGESTSAVVADFDRDGDLDVFLGGGGNLMTLQPDPIYNAKNAAADQYFVNEGHGHFVDRTKEAGLGDTGWALAATGSDYDNDGDVDLFVANDFGYDCLYKNNGDGTFQDVANDVGIAYRGSSMGASFGDVDNDGDVDLFVTGMASNTRWIIDQPGYPAPAAWPLNVLFRPFILDVIREMFHGNRFYLNRGDGTFAEVSQATGTRNCGWAWSGLFVDYDNDSNLDLYVLNGLVSGAVKDDL